MTESTKAHWLFLLAGFTIIAVLLFYSRGTILLIWEKLDYKPQVTVTTKEAQPEQKKQRVVPQGKSLYINQKLGFNFLYPDTGYSLCFNEMDCLEHERIAFVSVVPDERSDKMGSHFFKLEPLGSSIGLDPAFFANMIRRINEKEGVFIQKSEKETKIDGVHAYAFDVKGGFYWNGYTSDGDFIKVNKHTKGNSGLIYDPARPLTVVYFSQNETLYQLMYEKNTGAEEVLSTLRFEW